jgi:hypothetical protein
MAALAYPATWSCAVTFQIPDLSFLLTLLSPTPPTLHVFKVKESTERAVDSSKPEAVTSQTLAQDPGSALVTPTDTESLSFSQVTGQGLDSGGVPGSSWPCLTPEDTQCDENPALHRSHAVLAPALISGLFLFICKMG